MAHILGMLLMTLLAMTLGFLLLSILRHRIQLRREMSVSPPPGQLVDSNGMHIHVFATGSGSPTLVFLSGHGTPCPTLDFKPLWRRLSDTYRVVVVERPGYGWSEPSDRPRSLETILAETRNSLKAVGEKGPFVLVPHSMAGLEALFWAQKYPEEVKAIIGLDALTPRAVGILPKSEKLPLHLMAAGVRFGLFRWVPRSKLAESFPLMNTDELTAEEKKAYMQMFYRSGYSKNMLREVDFLEPNAEKVAKGEHPYETPVLCFLSREQGRNVPGWIKAIEEDLSVARNIRTEILETGHYLHYDRAESIAQRVKRLLKSSLS